ncbi:ribbon-helix-helix protein, CopG family [Haloarcula hispanica]|jgi:predicted DNA-binding protein|uniref:Ribbon-helix-helix protein, CopG family n=1 Tax=Haloarcula hispanica TaxID=51589 RepID=A0A482TEN8_HALHI|nr:ribbon-helix-helix domain-containing protein [Haloarcula hispanica]MCJ0620096.1 ribbon-helix-helix protein, CopG family [Haloarcula hispanica]RYJ10529.1 ribbon-helix-helix protein, CopG family [Haloarcula hispanica]
MVQRSLSVSISLPTEMDERISEQAEKHEMTYSQYVRQAIREHEGTPFECDDTVLCVDGNSEKSRNEGAA